MLSAILKTTGVPFLVSVLAKLFSDNENPKLRKAGQMLDEVSVAISDGLLSEDEQKELSRHAEVIFKAEAEKDAKIISEINQSIRIESQSADEYVRRMRPTFGYLMALTWTAQMLAVAYVLVFETAQADVVIEAVGSLSPIWAVGLSVLGIYVYKRSEDKRLK